MSAPSRLAFDAAVRWRKPPLIAWGHGLDVMFERPKSSRAVIAVSWPLVTFVPGRRGKSVEARDLLSTLVSATGGGCEALLLGGNSTCGGPRLCRLLPATYPPRLYWAPQGDRQAHPGGCFVFGGAK